MARSPDTEEQTTDEYTAAWSRVQELIRAGQSWSGRERNCVFLNTGDASFADASAVTGLDFPDDGRGLAPVDWDADGDLDLWITNRSGPRVRFMLNNCANNDRYVAFRLIGEGANRDAIGAEVEVHLMGASDRRLVRTLRAGSGFISQGSKWVHFGLPEGGVISHITVRWPGGQAQDFSGCAAGARWVLSESTGEVAAWRRSSEPISIAAGPLPKPEDQTSAKIPIIAPLPMLGLRAKSGSGQELELLNDAQGGTLLMMWAEWCSNCKRELKEVAEAKQQLEASGLRVIAINVDEASALSGDDSFLHAITWPFESVTATPELLSILGAIQHTVLSRPKPEIIPTSYLIDRNAQLQFIYRGAISIEGLLADAQLPEESPAQRRTRFAPYAGWWPNETVPTRFRTLAINLRNAGHPELASEYLKRITLSAPKQDIPESAVNKIFGAQMNTGTELLQKGMLDEATAAFKRAAELLPDNAQANKLLGVCLQKQGQDEAALPHLKLAAREDPEDAETWNDLGLTLVNLRRLEQAGDAFETAVRLDPLLAKARLNLGVFQAQNGELESALSQVAKATELNPRYIEAWATLTQIHIVQGSHEEALKAATEASTAAAHERGDLIGIRASLLLRLGRRDEAASLLPALEAVAPQRATELRAALKR